MAKEVAVFSPMTVMVPTRVWSCMDCGTLSDAMYANEFHVGHVGTRRKVKPEFFEQKKPIIRVGSGEVIWVPNPQMLALSSETIDCLKNAVKMAIVDYEILHGQPQNREEALAGIDQVSEKLVMEINKIREYAKKNTCFKE